LQRTN